MPFCGEGDIETLNAILHMAAPPLPPLGPVVGKEAPAEIERILQKCLAKDPGARYQSLREVVVDLGAARRLIESGPVTPANGLRSAPPRIARPLVRLTSRRMVFLAAVLVTIVVAAAWWGWRRTRAGTVTPIEPVSILIANFENGTGQPLFDGLLEQALGLGLEEASIRRHLSPPRCDAPGTTRHARRHAGRTRCAVSGSARRN